MSQVSITIPLTRSDEARLLFGPGDAHLRKIRETLGTSVVLRGDSIVLEGDDEQVRKTKAVFERLREVLRRDGIIHDDLVTRVLGTNNSSAAVSLGSEIDLFEKAKKVRPRTAGQQRYVDAIRKHDLIFCAGPAGCGKTYLAVAMAVNALRSEQVRRIVLVRPAVEAGEKLGFLPGDMLAKVNPFLRPLLDAMNDMLNFEQVRLYMENDVVEIVPLAFMRGRTLNDTFIILDEAQNTTTTQMKMFLTRMGEGSKIVVTGDPTQTDLPESVGSGFNDAVARLQRIEGVTLVELGGEDIVRHRLVREIVKAYDQAAPVRTP
ncbi:PhoH family protein [Planctomicrobium piriforme]|uniref:PhoH-like protein n=1 Tax=Planctomicrobium piriforme TaxID=1576369 RepID=A0A1I3BMD3_9PLAN|nr:PhoH family protein [Planctomicrobium piriforme]SFH63403.1 phosphate starvation-inducible protein PhoH [Planctomicrobium piriforme]